MTDASTIKAIETRYKGHRFRSRLEARWAVFFDHAGVEWLYEPQGYVLSDGKPYLPDFWLPSCDAWVEVKGHDGALDVPRMLLAAAELPSITSKRKPRLIILGNPPSQAEYDPCWTCLEEYPCSDFGGTVVMSLPCRFGMWHKEKRPWYEGSQFRVSTTPEDLGFSGSLEVENAYRAFHSARFEHGECG